MSEKDKRLIGLLDEEWQLLTHSVATLKKSVEKCNQLVLKKEFSFEDEESFDSLTSKFNRTSDLYTQKVLRTIRMLLHEPFVPLIDTMNDFEKISIINASDEMIEIRDLKNQIVHEYLPEAVQELVPEVLQKTEVLNRNIERTKAFITNRNWIEIYMNNSFSSPINPRVTPSLLNPRVTLSLLNPCGTLLKSNV